MSMQQMDLSGFTSVDIRGSFDFEVVRSDAYRVNIERSGLMHPQAVVRGDNLAVYEPWYDLVHWLTPWKTPRVRVEMPELHGLSVSGASTGVVTGFSSSRDLRLKVRGASRVTGELEAGKAEMDIAGASRLRLGLHANQLRLNMAGASRLNGDLKADRGDIHVVGASVIGVKGTLGDASINVAGASNLDLENLTVHNAEIRLVGAGRCYVRVDGKMDAELAGASRLVYAGNPVMGNIRTVGASQLARA